MQTNIPKTQAVLLGLGAVLCVVVLPIITWYGLKGIYWFVTTNWVYEIEYHIDDWKESKRVPSFIPDTDKVTEKNVEKWLRWRAHWRLRDHSKEDLRLEVDNLKTQIDHLDRQPHPALWVASDHFISIGNTDLLAVVWEYVFRGKPRHSQLPVYSANTKELIGNYSRYGGWIEGPAPGPTLLERIGDWLGVLFLVLLALREKGSRQQSGLPQVKVAPKNDPSSQNTISPQQPSFEAQSHSSGPVPTPAENHLPATSAPSQPPVDSAISSANPSTIPNALPPTRGGA